MATSFSPSTSSPSCNEDARWRGNEEREKDGMTLALDFYLDWSINCQFAGLIWALEDGLFAAEGLDVRLVPPEENPDTSVLDLVLAGDCRVGCMEDNLIVRAVAAGKGVKAVGATMQESPIHLVTLPESGMTSLADVVGRRIAMHRDGIHLLETVLELHGIDPGLMETTVAGWTLDQLLDGTFDAVQGYATTEPHHLRRLGHATRLIPIRHHDLRPWAQMMFTTDAMIAAHGQALGRFLAACRQGWLQAMTNLDDCARLVAARSREHGDVAENCRILELMLPLVAGDEGLDRAVSTDPERWKRNLATYARSGMIAHAPAYNEVVCDDFACHVVGPGTRHPWRSP